MTSLDNPFGDYGKVVKPDRFVGRQSEISRLQQRVLSSNGGGCAAIVGEARIGKTSLMQYVFHRDDPLVRQVRGIVVSFNVSAMAQSAANSFFVSIVREIQRELRRISPTDHGEIELFAQELYRSVSSNSSDWNLSLLEYFDEIGRKNYRIIILLDEFEGITRVFGQDESSFQLLRQLGYDHRYSTVIVTTSRISIGQIEVQSLISTLAGTFADIHLGLFNDTEFDLLLDTRVAGNKMSFTKRERQRIRDFAGLHPFYAQIAGFHVWDYKARNSKEALANHELDLAVDQCRSEIYEKFDNCRNRMGSGQFDALLSITLGPSAIATSPLHINKLLQQGHIYEVQMGAETTYKPFSKAFEEYLRFQQRQVDLWPLWTETEKGLRDVIGTRYAELAAKNRTPLRQLLQQEHPRLYEKYCRYEDDQRREARHFSVTTAPFDYMDPSDIFEFLEERWQCFKDVFGPLDRVHIWRNKFETLRMVRNPYAHSREHAVSDARRREAESICNEILSLLRKAEAIK